MESFVDICWWQIILFPSILYCRYIIMFLNSQPLMKKRQVFEAIAAEVII